MLQINEIYRTILGESADAGRPCIIVRLTGCHRRCVYCDTAYAFEGGREMTVDQVAAEVCASGSRTVLVTGGEPLLQADVVPLLQALVEANMRVVLETSGTKAPVPLQEVPRGVKKVVDIKTPGSGVAADQIDWDGIAGLGHDDELKFVCCDRNDYLWIRDLLAQEVRWPPNTPISLSPSHEELAPADLANWILADGLEVRLQIQLHKVLWPDRERGT